MRMLVRSDEEDAVLSGHSLARGVFQKFVDESLVGF